MTSLMVNWTTTNMEAEATSWSSGGGSGMVMMVWSSGGSGMVMMASHCDCWFVWVFW
jgi:hypothetical protein